MELSFTIHCSFTDCEEHLSSSAAATSATTSTTSTTPVTATATRMRGSGTRTRSGIIMPSRRARMASLPGFVAFVKISPLRRANTMIARTRFRFSSHGSGRDHFSSAFRASRFGFFRDSSTFLSAPLTIITLLPTIQSVSVDFSVFSHIDIIGGASSGAFPRRVTTSRRFTFASTSNSIMSAKSPLVALVGVMGQASANGSRSSATIIPFASSWSIRLIMLFSVVPSDVSTMPVAVSVISVPPSVMVIVAEAVAVSNRTIVPVAPPPSWITKTSAIHNGTAIIIRIIVSRRVADVH